MFLFRCLLFLQLWPPAAAAAAFWLIMAPVFALTSFAWRSSMRCTCFTVVNWLLLRCRCRWLSSASVNVAASAEKILKVGKAATEQGSVAPKTLSLSHQFYSD